MYANDVSYNGHANYPTWAIYMFLSNSESDWNYIDRLATNACEEEESERRASIRLAKEMQEFFENRMPELDGAFVDLLQYAVDQIRWLEIAEGLVGEIRGTE